MSCHRIQNWRKPYNKIWLSQYDTNERCDIIYTLTLIIDSTELEKNQLSWLTEHFYQYIFEFRELQNTMLQKSNFSRPNRSTKQPQLRNTHQRPGLSTGSTQKTSDKETTTSNDFVWELDTTNYPDLTQEKYNNNRILIDKVKAQLLNEEQPSFGGLNEFRLVKSQILMDKPSEEFITLLQQHLLLQDVVWIPLHSISGSWEKFSPLHKDGNLNLWVFQSHMPSTHKIKVEIDIPILTENLICKIRVSIAVAAAREKNSNMTHVSVQNYTTPPAFGACKYGAAFGHMKTQKLAQCKFQKRKQKQHKHNKHRHTNTANTKKTRGYNTTATAGCLTPTPPLRLGHANMALRLGT